VPGECAVSSIIEQLLYDRVPRGNRHPLLVRPLPQSLTDYTRCSFKFFEHGGTRLKQKYLSFAHGGNLLLAEWGGKLLLHCGDFTGLPECEGGVHERTE
jgi:hypothetical protein